MPMIFRNRGRFAGTDGISNGERDARDVGEQKFPQGKDRRESGRERSI